MRIYLTLIPYYIILVVIKWNHTDEKSHLIQCCGFNEFNKNPISNMYRSNNHQHGPLKSSDRLWNIAESVPPDRRINHFQAMLALLKNPHAFRIPCNLNSLKKVGVYTITRRNASLK